MQTAAIDGQSVLSLVLNNLDKQNFTETKFNDFYKCECVTLKSALALNHGICILPTGLIRDVFFFFFQLVLAAGEANVLKIGMDGWTDACTPSWTHCLYSMKVFTDVSTYFLFIWIDIEIYNTMHNYKQQLIHILD